MDRALLPFRLSESHHSAPPVPRRHGGAQLGVCRYQLSCKGTQRDVRGLALPKWQRVYLWEAMGTQMGTRGGVGVLDTLRPPAC